MLEIATTAEATAGTDTSRAITAATLAAVAAKSEPYLIFVSVSDASGGAEILSKNSKASSWTIFHVSGFPTWTVVHNIGIASAGELNINISPIKDLGAKEFELQTVSASAFSFAAWNASVTVSVGNGLDGRIFIQAHRIV
jgi:hypothetical protein